MRARFRSRFDPGGASPALLYARALTEPLAWSMTGVMVAATTAVLSGQNPLAWLLPVVPLLYVLASGYAVYRLRSLPAELVLEAGRGVVRSVWEVAAERPFRLYPVVSRRRTRDGLSVALGRTMHTFQPDEWPDYEALEDAILAAAAEAPPVPDAGDPALA